MNMYLHPHLVWTCVEAWDKLGTNMFRGGASIKQLSKMPVYYGEAIAATAPSFVVSIAPHCKEKNNGSSLKDIQRTGYGKVERKGNNFVQEIHAHPMCSMSWLA